MGAIGMRVLIHWKVASGKRERERGKKTFLQLATCYQIEWNWSFLLRFPWLRKAQNEIRMFNESRPLILLCEIRKSK